MNRKRTQRVYLDNRVYNYIIEKIINSKYKQGEMIRIDAIADELKISRTPVTQAIKTLASEDILTLTSTGKAYIPTFTPKQLVDIYQTRIAVEKYAVEALCCREDRTDIYRSLNHIQTVCRNCFERSAYLEYRKEDLLLHRTLVELTENEYLYGLFVKIQNMFMISNYLVGTHTLEQQQLSLEEHDQLIKAIYEGNKETAVCSIENHIIRALKQVLSKFALDVTEESMRAFTRKERRIMKYRIGIDVGGTFTDAVCVNAETYELVGYLKVPTTHTAAEGVSKGIVLACRELMNKYGISPNDVAFIAHGTTQATNALLEGDVEDVGIVCIGEGSSNFKANLDTTMGDIELSDNKYLHTEHAYIDNNSADYEANAKTILDSFKENGIKTIVAASSFSVDDPTKENRFMDIAGKGELLPTSTHEVSKLYGLRVRTRTATINASILPKMIETAIMTDDSIRKSGITAPLMIMRCDGGVMDVEEVKKRPVLTMLSGPAAGVAGALMYEKISDGIFLEVGGTSTDISAIRNGRVMLKYAEVGGHKTYVNSLDIRTIGIAGGSMVRFSKSGVVDAGPRSAHIAQLPYACYANPEEIVDPKVFFFSPKHGDPDDYGAVECSNGNKYAITVSCAANYLGYVKEEHYAYGNKESAGKVLKAFGDYLGLSPEEVARQIMQKAAAKVAPVVKELIDTYDLDARYTYLVGGGGGSAAIVPFSAEMLNMKHRISKNAEVISPIGVALAMVRDVVERIIINPTQQDMNRIWSEAFDAAVNAGANPETIEVVFEIEAEKNLIRAIASGTTELRTKEMNSQTKTEEELKAIVAETQELPVDKMEILATTGRIYAVGGKQIRKKLFGLKKEEYYSYTLIDDEGVIRIQKPHGDLKKISSRSETRSEISRLVSHNTNFDGGEVLPDVFVFFNKQIKSFVGMPDKNQLLSLIMMEIEPLPADTEVYVLAVNKE